MTERNTDKGDTGRTESKIDKRGPYPSDSTGERSDETGPGDSRAPFSISRRRACASLLGISGFGLLSDPVGAADGGVQETNRRDAFTSPRMAHTVTFPNPEPEEGPEYAQGEYFGRAVALSADGNAAIVSAPEDDPLIDPGSGESFYSDNAGRAYVFARTGTGWNVRNPITLSHRSGWDHFGSDVAMNADGTAALVGAPFEHIDVEFEVGRAYLFSRTETGWNTTDPVSFTDYSADDYAFFGWSLGLSADGSTVLVGAPENSPASTPEPERNGTVHVFTEPETGWEENPQSEETLSYSEPGDRFGWDVAISADGQTTLVGAPGHDTGTCADVGAAYVFGRTDAGWNADAPVVLPNPAADAGDRFGDAVALSADGRTALVGAPDDASTAGAAYLFERTDEGWKTSPIPLPAPEPCAGDGFGGEVALSADGTVALVTGRADGTDAAERVGEAYLFRRTDGGWETGGPLVLSNPEPDADDFFGSDVTLSGDGGLALVGAPGDDTDSIEDAGEAYLFERR